MPSSGRNASPNAGSNTKSPIPLEDLYDPPQPPNDAAQAQQLMQAEERPTEPTEVRFRLNQSKVPSQLGTELWELWSMELTRSNSDGNIFIVSGIPPNYDIGEHEVMEVVKKHAKNAELV